MKRIQIFTAGEQTCEVDGYLVTKLATHDGFLYCSVIDIDGKDVTDYVFSTNSLSFVRIWKEKGDK